MTRLTKCDDCGKHVDTHDIWCWDTQRCEACMDEWLALQIAFWKPIWEAEKSAGIHLSKAEYDAELRDAGRGHLVENLGDF